MLNLIFTALIVEKKHTRIYINASFYLAESAMSRKPAYKHFQSAESFIAARDVFFCIPFSREGENVFNFAQGYYWRSRTDKTARERARSGLRLGSTRYVLSWPFTLYRRQFRNIGNLSVSQSCSAKEGGRQLAELETTVYITPSATYAANRCREHTKFTLNFARGWPHAHTHTHTQGHKLTHISIDATTIAQVYLRGIEFHGKILYPLFHELTSLLKGGVIVVLALQRDAKLAGALAANESAERSREARAGRRRFGSNDFVTTSDYSRPTGRFSKALKDEKEHVIAVICIPESRYEYFREQI